MFLFPSVVHVFRIAQKLQNMFGERDMTIHFLYLPDPEILVSINCIFVLLVAESIAT